MCSTPKGSGFNTRVTRIDYSKPDDSSYTDMLRRASQRYEAHQQVHGKQDVELDKQNED
jgi:hypothetical protein